MPAKKDTTDLLKAGKAKMKARLEIAMRHIKRKVSTHDLIKTGHAKQKTRARIVQNYLSTLEQRSY